MAKKLRNNGGWDDGMKEERKGGGKVGREDPFKIAAGTTTAKKGAKRTTHLFNSSPLAFSI